MLLIHCNGYVIRIKKLRQLQIVINNYQQLYSKQLHNEAQHFETYRSLFIVHYFVILIVLFLVFVIYSIKCFHCKKR